ncbi:class II fumarate hydratase [Desulfatitalea alkaliphila]|uniref:Fumarate hydratase class II n=1 Tax=Desulfatitalea alkaliphila TaxID=2929485 RepID=A0AA41R3W4_9BACT|nr:class II fumarate hydratase [Desulfatitalea alkaliphila]MCJ8501879.1 class II fumarate hydratase [Desulfatitalea alkaliphila]
MTVDTDSQSYREEQDSMGTVRVPADAYYGSQTQRAVDNFMQSGLKPPLALIRALALIKRLAAETNLALGLLPDQSARAIVQAAHEVAAGRWDDQFVVDLFQTGSGTSTNMNMNEVLAGRANEILTGRRGGRAPVHPNDHVNLGQSSNDLIPSALHVAAVMAIHNALLPALTHLQSALAEKRDAFAAIRKIGRTHLQDAVPMTLGEAFSAFVRQIELGGRRVEGVLPRLTELALGGTAVGNGLNTHPEFAARTIAALSSETGIVFKEAANRFEAQAARDAAVETSGAVKTVAVSLIKIANDIRWMGSGPRCGIGELQLPALQPGSSIMPGKVNPVIPEAVIQVAYQVMGNDTAIALAGQSGNFELNVTLPLVAHNLLQSVELLAGAARLLADKCVRHLAADRQRCEGYIEQSLALATALVPHIGYDRAAELAKRAYESGRTVRQVAAAEKLLPEETLNRLLG